MIGPAEVRDALDRHGRVAVILVTRAEGSTPREAGAAMLLTASGSQGTIGGGTVEFQAIARAQAMLDAGVTAHDSYAAPLGPDLDQCCGGRMEIAIAVLDRTTNAGGEALALWPGGPELLAAPPTRPVTIYGAGHVGRALARALAPLPFRVTLIAVRDEGDPPGARDLPEEVATVLSALPEAEVAATPDDALHLVMTHSHALDLEIVTAVLTRPHVYCGLIGSATKAALFRRRLTERGLPEAAIAGLACPIGLPDLHDKRPAVIAASVAADLLQRVTQ